MTEAEKAYFNSQKYALIFEQFADLNTAQSLERCYFVLDRSSWNLSEMKLVDLGKLKELTFFFLPEQFNSKDCFSASEIFKITKDILAVTPDIKFDFPFGHDSVDVRHPGHLAWTLVPDQITTNTAFPGNDEEILFSIIIPYYKRNFFLKKVLQHLERQLFDKKNFEVILVDDGSPVGQMAQMQSFIEKIRELKVRHIYVKRDFGLMALSIGNRAGPARNLGAVLSRGKFFLFLDSDILLHKNYLSNLALQSGENAITISKRIYLTRSASNEEGLDIENVADSQTFEPPWYEYIKQFYERNNWKSEQFSWKFFITYCLSMPKDLFLATGGFRTNYISFGYEDLDLGIRATKISSNLRLLNSKVYHLYHFEGDYEYTMDVDFRFFQLAMTSRIFSAQNSACRAEYLIEMTRLKTLRQKFIFGMYKFMWSLKNQVGGYFGKVLL